jgi:hypothetical protein
MIFHLFILGESSMSLPNKAACSPDTLLPEQFRSEIPFILESPQITTRPKP